MHYAPETQDPSRPNKPPGFPICAQTQTPDPKSSTLVAFEKSTNHPITPAPANSKGTAPPPFLLTLSLLSISGTISWKLIPGPGIPPLGWCQASGRYTPCSPYRSRCRTSCYGAVETRPTNHCCSSRCCSCRKRACFHHPAGGWGWCPCPGCSRCCCCSSRRDACCRGAC